MLVVLKTIKDKQLHIDLYLTGYVDDSYKFTLYLRFDNLDANFNPFEILHRYVLKNLCFMSNFKEIKIYSLEDNRIHNL